MPDHHGPGDYRRPLDPDLAAAVWNILVVEAGAPSDPTSRLSFVARQSVDFYPEWRFIGSLGFGGKFRRAIEFLSGEVWERMYVDCYPEDRTPARLDIIHRVNSALEVLLPDIPPSEPAS